MTRMPKVARIHLSLDLRYQSFTWRPHPLVIAALSCRFEITGEFGLVNVGSIVQGDSAKVFPVHIASSAVNDPLAQHHTCQCTVARPSDCDAGQRSQARRCYTATCPTGTMDGYRSCTCAWAHETDHSPPHGCTAEVHCAIESGQPLPPNCSSDAVWYDNHVVSCTLLISKLRRHKISFTETASLSHK